MSFHITPIQSLLLLIRAYSLITHTANNDILVNELQLGETLNKCVHKKERSQFSLLLAMLNDDVQAHAQFSLPKTEDQKNKKEGSSLRDLFKLPQEQSLSINNFEQIKAYNQASLLKKESLTELSLLNALKPTPLAFRNNNKFISKNILDNTSLHCQKKYKLENSANSAKEVRLNFQAQEWLNTVKESIHRFPNEVNQ